MISPLDIRQHNFKRGMRGYDTDEVRAYLNALGTEVQGLQQQLADQKLELERLRAANARYQETEQMLHRTLQQAELSSKAVVDNAKREAELILAEADQRANEMLQKAYDERTRLDNDLGDLYARRAEALQQIERFLTTQTEQIRTFRDNEPHRLPRAEPPRKRAVRDVQPLPSDPPTPLAASTSRNTPAEEEPVAKPQPVLVATAEVPVVVELEPMITAQHPGTDRPETARKPTPEGTASVMAALQPALRNDAPARPVAPKPEPVTATEPTDPAAVLKKKRASFFDEALATAPHNQAVDDLLEDL